MLKSLQSPGERCVYVAVCVCCPSNYQVCGTITGPTTLMSLLATPGSWRTWSSVTSALSSFPPQPVWQNIRLLSTRVRTTLSDTASHTHSDKYGDLMKHVNKCTYICLSGNSTLKDRLVSIYLFIHFLGRMNITQRGGVYVQVAPTGQNCQSVILGLSVHFQ